MHKSSYFDKSISHIMNYVILKYSPSLESCDLAVLLYATFHINKVELFKYGTQIVLSSLL